jgi:hypothetical protein
MGEPMNEQPNIESNIVAKYEGRRILIPVDAAELTLTHEPAEPVSWDPRPRHFTPGIIRVDLHGVTPQYVIWEDGANPEDLRREQLQQPSLEIEPGVPRG